MDCFLSSSQKMLLVHYQSDFFHWLLLLEILPVPAEKLQTFRASAIWPTLHYFFEVHLTPKFLLQLKWNLATFTKTISLFSSVSDSFKGFKHLRKVAEICYHLCHDWASEEPGSIPQLMSQTHLHRINSLWICMQNSLRHQTRNRPMPLTSSVMTQKVSNFR